MAQPFGGTLEFIEIKDRSLTGNFEVTILDTGELIHSKRSGRGGKATTSAERNAIAIKIEDALEELAG